MAKNKLKKIFSSKTKPLKGLIVIELLVVIAVLSLLGSLILVEIRDARAIARDGKRDAEAGEERGSLRKALEMYYFTEGKYPHSINSETDDGCCIEEDDAIQTLLAPYFYSIPEDPLYKEDDPLATDPDPDKRLFRFCYHYRTTNEGENFATRVNYERGGYKEVASSWFSMWTGDDDDGTFSTIPMKDAFSVFVSGNYAYVTSGDPAGKGLNKIKITDPSNPILEESSNANLSNPVRVIISGNYAYIANGTEKSLYIYDINDIAEPLGTISFSGLSSAHSIAVSGNYAYVIGDKIGATDNNFRVIDISDPENPQEIIGLQLKAAPNDIKISGNYAYIVGGYHFSIVNISDPENPEIKKEICDNTVSMGCGGDYYHLKNSVAIEVSGNFAYIMTLSGPATPHLKGLTVIDISDPNNLKEEAFLPIDEINTTYLYSDIDISGNFAYVGSYMPPGYIITIDITDPSNPVETNIFSNDEIDCPYQIFIHGSHAYIAVHCDDNLSIISLDEL
ncbi:hypothetical protein KAS79_04190 [Candidatus Parcubacteria bacterium]|nr:hypothetical protein [Candidatus Parcubacteria bacterium]